MGKEDKKSKQPPISDLMKKLLEPQDVVISRYRTSDGTPKIDDFKEAVSRGFFLIKFPKIFGGTEIGVNLKNLPKDFGVEYSPDNTTIKVSGKVEFQNIPTRFKASFRLDSFEGTGCLELL
ncbi:hypothetical protein CYY_001240 [Polysphondylium violaceum]|uniref:Uncharacterized protein n=1 Tax=Polysphondylium violaceum TaxID=133409 RepID=A0A8J4Q2C8_9MYCE|nr:hypothetical protein CYY_001240 [Polysphondylium violaceum]